MTSPPKTYNEKLISLILIIVGIFIVSTITAAISSFLTERLLESEDEDLEKTVNENVDEKFEILDRKLDSLQEENRMLKDEIHELKEMIENKD